MRRYVDGLRTHKQSTSDASRRATLRRLERIDVELITATPMGELKLVQERQNLLELTAWYAVEDAFIEAARTYSVRHGISYDTWRTIGVPPSVLRRAGIRATHSRAPRKSSP